MLALGPISSISGSRRFYVDLSPQLDTSELVNGLAITSDNSNIIISSPTILAADLTTKSGAVLSANKAVSFRAACSGGDNAISSIYIDYTTDASNHDITIVKLRLVPEIL